MVWKGWTVTRTTAAPDKVSHSPPLRAGSCPENRSFAFPEGRAGTVAACGAPLSSSSSLLTGNEEKDLSSGELNTEVQPTWPSKGGMSKGERAVPPSIHPSIRRSRQAAAEKPQVRGEVMGHQPTRAQRNQEKKNKQVTTAPGKTWGGKKSSSSVYVARQEVFAALHAAQQALWLLEELACFEEVLVWNSTPGASRTVTFSFAWEETCLQTCPPGNTSTSYQKATSRPSAPQRSNGSSLTPNHLMGNGNLPRQTGVPTSNISASALTMLLDTATETPLSLHLLPTTPQVLETRGETHCSGPWHLSCSFYSTLGWRTSSSSQHN